MFTCRQASHDLSRARQQLPSSERISGPESSLSAWRALVSPGGALAVLLALIWLPTLRWGFIEDDFWQVPLTWHDFLDNPFQIQGRPVWFLTIVALPKNALAHRALSYALYVACLALALYVARRYRLSPWAAVLALAAFSHPAFLWSVTWIAQRNDLLLLIFLLLALAARSAVGTTSAVVLSTAAKSPYVFHGLVFAARFVRERRLAAAAVCIAAVAGFTAAGYVTYYQISTHHETLASPGIPLVVAALARLAKIAEGTFFVFAPIPAFAANIWLPILAALLYAGAWFVVLRTVRRSRLKAASFLGGVALATIFPFAFASDLRIAAPASVVIYLTAALAIEPTTRLPVRVSIVGLVALNLAGIALNYGMFRSAVYDICAQPVLITAGDTPASKFNIWRDDIRYRVLHALGVKTERRIVERRNGEPPPLRRDMEPITGVRIPTRARCRRRR